jgi:Fur family ferric uptake transcriptional regulator
MGFRITPQREMIVQTLAHSDHHLTAEEIYDQVRMRTQVINIATVYRTLELLVQQGLAARVLLQDGQMVYTPETHGPHIHLVCRQCGGVTDADQALFAPLVDDLRAQHGFRVDALHVSMTGLCRACQSRHATGG